jgi:hypothetical protein
MSLVCAQCSRVNPPEAAYCYHDGTALTGHPGGGPVNTGSVSFPTPFVFPSGLACRNFDQLAMACQQNWAAALDLLKQGFLASFFGGLGRVDLAVAAQEAAKFPDPDRGLDQLIGKLPTQVVEPPKLQAEPSDINLGQLPVGADRTVELHLRNTGMRLLYGSVASDSKWLTLGEAPGQPEKVFQFGEETTITVQVRGQHLRAGTRPLDGQLVVDANGGNLTIPVRADVPVTPFEGGLFDGALTPRKIAEHSKAHPKEAAPYFQDGRVAAWFQSNGWTYPVQGPPMSGMGAVQQFFEALGVAKPPQVQVAPTAVQVEGEPGKVFARTLEVSSPERKVVYGWAISDQDWVVVGKSKLTGRIASIPITITVPDRAGTHEARLIVVGNGQQRFAVPVTAAVIGGAEVLDAELVEEPAALSAVLIEEPVAAVALAAVPATAEAAAPSEPAALPARPPSIPSLDVGPPKVVLAPPPILPTGPIATPPPPISTNAADATVTFADQAPATVALSDGEIALDVLAPGDVISKPALLQGPPRPGGRSLWVHAIPLALLIVVLSGTCMRDALTAWFRPPSTPEHERPLLGLAFDYNFDPKRVDPKLGSSMMAGLVRYDPEHGKSAEPKRLTYGRHGHTNSVVLKIGGKERVFGDTLKNARWSMAPKDTASHTGKICEFQFEPERIAVTQEVRIVHGEPVEVGTDEKGAVYKRLLDTCLFRYKLENRGAQSVEVGLRYLLDTYIGNNDGVPFTLPGVPGLIDTFKELPGEQVPDFIQVLENPDLQQPGLIAQLNLRLGEKFEPPSRVRLTAHPLSQNKEGVDKNRWDIPFAPINDAGDSCVVLYWDPAPLAPGKYRELAFTYGLGNVSIGDRAKLGVTVGGAMLVNRELTVVALVADPQPGQTVELQLPPGLERVAGTEAAQLVPPSTEKNKAGQPRPSPVTWRVRATTEGEFRIVVETRIGGESVTQERRVKIERAKLF